MFGSRKKNLALLLVLGAFFVLGVGRLFLLRFEAGDIYPPYSTLRADPLGAKAFYDALGALGPVSVSRNYESLTRTELPEKTGLFFLGTRKRLARTAPRETVEVFERLILNGGTLVVAFHPERPRGTPRDLKQDEPKQKGASEKYPETRVKDAGNEQGEDRGAEVKETGDAQEVEEPRRGKEEGDDGTFSHFKRVSLEEKWGFALRHAGKKHYAYEALRASGPDYERLPAAVPWNSALYFDEIEEPWQAVYTCGDGPVIVERPFGRGRLVLSSDSYLFSNEAMSVDRNPRLLAWFVGHSRNLVFDETHLGSGRSPGIMTLAWEYDLYWPALSLVLLAALFIWRNTSHLVPPRDEAVDENEAATAARDSTSGLVSLLRRSVPAKDLLETCYKEWHGHFMWREGFHSDKVEKVKAKLGENALGPGRTKDPVRTYKDICKILSRSAKP